MRFPLGVMAVFEDGPELDAMVAGVARALEVPADTFPELMLALAVAYKVLGHVGDINASFVCATTGACDEYGNRVTPTFPEWFERLPP